MEFCGKKCDFCDVTKIIHIATNIYQDPFEILGKTKCTAVGMIFEYLHDKADMSMINNKTARAF